jgi:hypothetical protein
LLQLLLETPALRHVVRADDNPTWRAGLLRRRRNNRLDDRVALSSLVSVCRALAQTCYQMAFDF